ncbi:MAG TPA: membrane protein insertase YidC [Terracidiphilus sp.]|nr:membrane protein insertase YidC [Terracidiphilus sp.]
MPEFKNPNLESQGPGGGGGSNSGGDFRSLMTFMLLAVLIFLGFQYFKQKQDPNQPATQTQQSTQPTPSQTPATATTSAVSNPSATATGAPTVPAVTAAAETETTVENELYRIVFTNRGGQAKHWILKKYFSTDGKPLDLVQPQLAAHFGMPLSLFTYESALTTELNQSLYQASASGTLLAPNTLTFRYAQNGLDVVKTFRFDSSYVIHVDSEVRRNGAEIRALVDWPSALGDMEEFLPSSTTRSTILTQTQLVTSIGGKQDTTAAAKVSGNATAEQSFDYAAIIDLYFTMALLPDAPQTSTLVTQHNTVDVLSDLSNPSSQKKPAPVIGVAMGDINGPAHLRVFAGPKQTDVLKVIHASGADGKQDGPGLDSLIQYGIWTFIAKPLYLALRWLHTLLGSGPYSWGWAIIIFTTTFTLIMLPFRFMAMRSSLKMMRIQPKVEALKKRYSHLKINDPKRAEMNAEMMQLYKTEGVNMYGGCLPMLPQIPLFFAYFRVLQYAVELRQAHWFWLKDLSTPDPLHILPIMIIISMFLTQYITPSPGMDPAQRRMMAFIMPVFMGFILFNYASGLALYWGTSNLINLLLQLSINQSSMGKEMHDIAARRNQKKSNVAPGKVIQGKR